MYNNVYHILCLNIVIGRGPGFDLWKLIKILFFTIGVTFVILFLSSCKRAIEIPAPVDSITTSQTFGSDANANSALAGIYSRMINTQNDLDFASGAITIFTGLSSDELSTLNSSLDDFTNNSLLADNTYVSAYLWASAYFTIYKANACVEGLDATKSVTETLRKQLLGEAKFVRAFSYFYLTNLFGDVPLITSTAWKSQTSMARTAKDQIYTQIISDLKDAQSLLSNDYSFSNGERTKPNKWAATALLARVYLYQKDWNNALTQSTSIISNSTLFSLEDDLSQVFLNTSHEAIWQLQPSNILEPYATVEGRNVVPVNNTRRANYTLTSDLINSFDSADKRKAGWINTSINGGTPYIYPYKYKIKIGAAGGTITEYYMMLRFAEQYLIRAEAYANLNKLPEAISDLNVIRQRAGITLLSTSLTQQQVMDAIVLENQREFFSEWGHRWLDLKRWNLANTLLATVKGSNWQSTDQLYPIPYIEIQTNPNLSQNSGY